MKPAARRDREARRVLARLLAEQATLVRRAADDYWVIYRRDEAVRLYDQAKRIDEAVNRLAAAIARL